MYGAFTSTEAKAIECERNTHVVALSVVQLIPQDFCPVYDRTEWELTWGGGVVGW